MKPAFEKIKREKHGRYYRKKVRQTLNEKNKRDIKKTRCKVKIKDIMVAEF